VVQALEAILTRQASGRPGTIAEVNGPEGGLVLRTPGESGFEVLYPSKV
jgi:hypothetical protein